MVSVSFNSGDLVVPVKTPGYSDWPCFICPEDQLPQDFLDEKPKKLDMVSITFIGEPTYLWVSASGLKHLSKKDVRTYLNKYSLSKQKRLSNINSRFPKELVRAYEIALSSKNLSHYLDNYCSDKSEDSDFELINDESKSESDIELVGAHKLTKSDNLRNLSRSTKPRSSISSRISKYSRTIQKKKVPTKIHKRAQRLKKSNSLNGSVESIDSTDSIELIVPTDSTVIEIDDTDDDNNSKQKNDNDFIEIVEPAQKDEKQYTKEKNITSDISTNLSDVSDDNHNENKQKNIKITNSRILTPSKTVLDLNNSSFASEQSLAIEQIKALKTPSQNIIDSLNRSFELTRSSRYRNKMRELERKTSDVNSETSVIIDIDEDGKAKEKEKEKEKEIEKESQSVLKDNNQTNKGYHQLRKTQTRLSSKESDTSQDYLILSGSDSE
ncbi:uncharacterized protein ASCRUDRAFT_70146 [Ascoidea rubescens DSM 1968]|uniref:PWWP domain-containing protein n=1 Tax=Ascoidea rubescens DSM 1968 TaxID=1344418 RepID=A0A1D2VJ75_9ASCO|nr:hypothetical protein ASCRUDRAFT_70146 [Ascoidea rubescens DSM 1968]ODV61684.1 hypothetical protein ASCRUDRAFT_70146 [Ascoidea rubescens DSM 1968]